jgi:Na+/H+-dicarboxylate symporter
MVIVLRAVGLPLEGIGMILAIDWFLDRCRTTVNVWGDAVGAAVVDRLEPGEVESPEETTPEGRAS